MFFAFVLVFFMVVCNIFVVAVVAAVRRDSYLNSYSRFLYFLLRGAKLTQYKFVSVQTNYKEKMRWQP